MKLFGMDVLGKRSLLAAAVCAVAFTGAGASGALAGEVKGPPGTPGEFGSGSEEDTAAPKHANSLCAFSGLNDFRPENGPIKVIVQTPGSEHHLEGVPAGLAGEECRGFSNFQNPREHP
jgi:hypothetical protein